LLQSAGSLVCPLDVLTQKRDEAPGEIERKTELGSQIQNKGLR